MASLKVDSFLSYQAAAFGVSVAGAIRVRPSAHTVINEYKPNRIGVVRRMARSDHWRWVWTPRWARTS
jgi:hypothetical protein